MIAIGSKNGITLKLGTETVNAAYIGTAQIYPNGTQSLDVIYNITSTSSATPLIGTSATDNIASCMIDGVTQSSVPTSYTFNTVGLHTVRFVLTDPTKISNNSYVFQNSVEYIKSIIVPEGVTRLESWFVGNTTKDGVLKTINLPSSLTYIGGSMLYNQKSIEHINLQDTSVTEVRGNFVANCTSLKEIIFPETVTSIGSSNGSCVYGCTALEYIEFRSAIPPTLTYPNNEFSNTNNCPIYVPAASVTAYQTASGWSNFASRIQAKPTA